MDWKELKEGDEVLVKVTITLLHPVSTTVKGMQPTEQGISVSPKDIVSIVEKSDARIIEENIKDVYGLLNKVNLRLKGIERLQTKIY